MKSEQQIEMKSELETDEEIGNCEGITEKIEEKTWQAIEGVTDEETYSEAKERAEVRRSDHVVVFIFVLGAVIAVVHLVIVYRLLYISKHLDVCFMDAITSAAEEASSPAAAAAAAKVTWCTRIVA